jgi:hypothetical protein
MKIKNILFSLLISTFFVLPVQAGESDYMPVGTKLIMEDSRYMPFVEFLHSGGGSLESLRAYFSSEGTEEPFLSLEMNRIRYLLAKM